MSANYGSASNFPHNLNELGEEAQINDQNNQFPYYPELWVGQPLGVILREYRLSYGLSLHQVSDELKIRSVYLDYLEKGEYENLPGQVYGQGFVRSYASFLGLPVDEMLAKYQGDSNVGYDNQTFDSVSAALSAEKSTPALGIILGVLLGLGILAYLIFFIYSRVSFETPAGEAENQVPLMERISTFIFGSDEVAPEAPTVSEDDAALLAGAGPIIVGVDGTISVAPAPKPQETATPQTPEPASAPAAATPERNTPEAAQDSYFPDRKSPRPKNKPDFSAVAGQTIQVAAPRATSANNPNGLISNVDSNVPLISPQAVTIGTPAFGQGVGFNSPAVTVSGANIANTAPIVLPDTPLSPSRANTDLATVDARENTGTTPTTPEPATNPNPEPELADVAPAPVSNSAASGNESRIRIQAVARTWIKVVGANEATLAEQLLATGDSFDVPNQDGLTLLTGSLQSLALSVDGRKVRTPESISNRTDTIKLDTEALLNQR